MNDITNRIAAAKAAVSTQAAGLIQVIQDYEQQYNARLSALEQRWPALVAALEDMGLAVSEFSHCATGNGQRVWGGETQLRVTLPATQIEGSRKFKFHTFRGYDARGASKNREVCFTKADKMAGVLKAATGFSVAVNSSSLEIDKQRTTKCVLIDMWIK